MAVNKGKNDREKAITVRKVLFEKLLFYTILLWMWKAQSVVC